jgi:hypothetical protein
MNRRMKPDEKQRELALFIEDRITVPIERQAEIESALAELLLDVANGNKAASLDGGSV